MKKEYINEVAWGKILTFLVVLKESILDASANLKNL